MTERKTTNALAIGQLYEDKDKRAERRRILKVTAIQVVGCSGLTPGETSSRGTEVTLVPVNAESMKEVGGRPTRMTSTNLARRFRKVMRVGAEVSEDV